jgi:hypothetical protein
LCWVFSRYILTNYLPRLASNHHPPDFCLLSSWDYRCEQADCSYWLLHAHLTVWQVLLFAHSFSNNLKKKTMLGVLETQVAWPWMKYRLQNFLPIRGVINIGLLLFKVAEIRDRSNKLWPERRPIFTCLWNSCHSKCSCSTVNTCLVFHIYQLSCSKHFVQSVLRNQAHIPWQSALHLFIPQAFIEHLLWATISNVEISLKSFLLGINANALANKFKVGL